MAGPQKGQRDEGLAGGFLWTGAAVAAGTALEWIVVDAPDERLAVWLIVAVCGVLAIGSSHPVAARWPLGALLWLPVAWYASEAVVDPVMRWHPYSWWSSTWAWSATLVLILVRHWALAPIDAWVARRWSTSRSSLVFVAVGFAVVASVVAAASEPAHGIVEWEAFVARVTSEGALTEERRAIAHDATAAREIDAPPLVRGARVVQMPADTGDTRLELLRMCRPRDGAPAVVVDLDDRSAYLPLPDRGTTCMRLHRGRLVRLSDVGFVGRVGPSGVAGRLLVLAAVLSLLLLVPARRAMARLERLRATHQAVVIRGRDGSGSSVRLDDGSEVELPGGVTASARYVLVLVDDERRVESYRLDPRRHSYGFVETDDPREVCIANALESVKRWEALALVTLAFLAMPAVLAWSRGLVVSLW